MDDYQPVAHICVQGEWMPLSQVEFLDISEDIQGFDIVTFLYEGKEYQSRVINKPA